jgi:hypothetical protein
MRNVNSKFSICGLSVSLVLTLSTCQSALFKGRSKSDAAPTPTVPPEEPPTEEPPPPPPPTKNPPIVDPPPPECDKDPQQQAKNPCNKPFYPCRKELDGKTDYFPIKAEVYYFGPDPSISQAPNYASKVAQDYANERKFLQLYFDEIVKSRKPIAEICMPNFAVSPRNFSEGFPGVNDSLATKVFEWFTFDALTKIIVPEDNTYHFKIRSDDGTILTINNQPVIVHDGQHDPQYKEGSIYLTKGVHNLTMRYFQGPRFQIALELYWRASGLSDDFVIVPMSQFQPR